MEFIGLVLAIACLALLVVEGAPALYTAVQDFQISHDLLDGNRRGGRPRGLGMR